MRQISPKLVAVLAATFAMLFAAGCSSDDSGLLPGDDAQQILTNLNRVEDLAADGECTAALESIETISAQISALPDSVDDRLKQNLRRGVRRLDEVTTTSCGESADESETVTETTTSETETTVEEDEGGIPSDETNTGETGPDRETGRPDRGGGGDNRDGGTGERPERPSPPRGDAGRGGGGGGGGGGGAAGPQQPTPGGGETDPGTNPDSGGISPEEPADGEGAP